MFLVLHQSSLESWAQVAVCFSLEKRGRARQKPHSERCEGSPSTLSAASRSMAHPAEPHWLLEFLLVAPPWFESKGRETLFPDEGWQKRAKPVLGRARTNQDKGTEPYRQSKRQVSRKGVRKTNQEGTKTTLESFRRATRPKKVLVGSKR